MIARLRFWLALRKRKAARIVEQERSRKAHWQAVRKHHARDPLWRGVA